MGLGVLEASGPQPVPGKLYWVKKKQRLSNIHQVHHSFTMTNLKSIRFTKDASMAKALEDL